MIEKLLLCRSVVYSSRSNRFRSIVTAPRSGRNWKTPLFWSQILFGRKNL